MTNRKEPRREKLTDAFIKGGKPDKDVKEEGKRIEIYDTMRGVSGLVLRVTLTGHRSFAFRYWYNGQSRQYTIGKYGTWSLVDARNETKKLKKLIDKGVDPVAERQNKRKAITPKTFEELATHYKDIHLPSLREKTRAEYTRIIDRELIPAFGKRWAKELTKGEITTLLDKKAIKEGSKTMANRIRTRLHSIYEFGISRGIVQQNPVSGTKPYEGGENESERYYTKQEICDLWDSFEQQNEPVRSYLKIITLTGQRRAETLYMKWKQVCYVKEEKFKGWVWSIPAELSKSKRVHEVPLSGLAIEIIENLKERVEGNPYVFASLTSDNPIGLKTVKRAVTDVRDISGITDFRLHDMRRSVATNLAELGTAQMVVSKILNHKSGGGGSAVTRIYNRYEYRKERQQALNRWSNYLQQILTGETEAIIHEIG